MYFDDNVLTSHPYQKGVFELNLAKMIAIILIIFSAFTLVSCKEDIASFFGKPSRAQLEAQLDQRDRDISYLTKVNQSQEKIIILHEDISKLQKQAIADLTEAREVEREVVTKAKTEVVTKVTVIEKRTDLTEAQKDEAVLDTVLESMTEAYNRLPSQRTSE